MSLIDRFSPERRRQEDLRLERLALYGAYNLQLKCRPEAFLPVFWVAPRLHKEMAGIGRSNTGALDAINAVIRLEDKGAVFKLSVDDVLPSDVGDCYERYEGLNPYTITCTGKIACAGAYDFDTQHNPRVIQHLPPRVMVEMEVMLMNPAILSEPTARLLI